VITKASRKQTQAVAMAIICDIATCMAQLPLPIEGSSTRPAIIASMATIKPAPLLYLARAAAPSTPMAAAM
jgi:hypothetical protein